MNVSSLLEVKKELQELPPNKLLELCISLAKYKKDNKEYLGYLLFQAHDPVSFVAEIKREMDEHFTELKSQKNLYYIKKSLRKLLRIINKYCKYIGNKESAVELLIYFCQKIIEAKIPIHESLRLENLFEAQIKKIRTLTGSLHEDLQSDYLNELNNLLETNK